MLPWLSPAGERFVPLPAGAWFVYSPDKAKRSARASRGDFACAAGGQEGRNLWFPPSCQSSTFHQARHGRGYRSPAKRMPPTCQSNRKGLAATPEGAGACPFLLLVKSGRRKLRRNALLRASARPDLRQQMPQIFGQTLNCLLPLKGKGVIRKRGENVVSPLLCARAAQAHRPRAPQRAAPPARCERAPTLRPAGRIPKRTNAGR